MQLGHISHVRNTSLVIKRLPVSYNSFSLKDNTAETWLVLSIPLSHLEKTAASHTSCALQHQQ